MEKTKTVLIVEDNLACLERNCILLSRNGFDCHTAANGLTALKEIFHFLSDDKIFDLILMDIRMPLIDGIAAVDIIREAEKLKGISYGNGSKIIMTTADDSRESLFSSFKNGCEAYLIKPFNEEDLLKKINEIFDDSLINK